MQTLYDKELRRAREGLDEIEHSRNDEVDKLSALHEEVRNMHDRILAVQADEKTKKNALKRNAVYVKSLEKDKTAAMTHKTKLDLSCQELEEQIAQGNELLASNKRELARLNEEIAVAEKDLSENVQPAYDDAKETMTTMTNERDDARRRMEGLYAKQGRGRQFRTKKERDTHLRSQIKELAEAKAEKEEIVHEKQTKLSSLRKTLACEEKEVASKKKELQEKSKLLEDLKRTVDEKRKVRTEMGDSRKEQWRAINELSDKVGDAKESSRRALYDCRKSMPRATSMGLEALKQIVVSEGLKIGQEYFGLVMENFELTDEKYQTAVEVAAQNSLFHVVVDTDGTAARLMKRLEDEKLGRVTFLPLNQLRLAQGVRYPESTDVAPLMEQCITFDPRVRNAMEHVFARKLLARSVDVASTWSARSNMDAITLDGDLCSRKGALTGGFIDVGKSRLRAHFTLKKAEESLQSLEKALAQKKQESTAVDQQVSNVMGEVQRLEAKHANLDHMMGRIEDDVKKLQKSTQRRNKQAKQIEEDVPPMETQIASLGSQIEHLEEEMGTDLTSTLTEEEQVLLEELKATQTRLDEEIEQHTRVLEEATIKRQKLTSLLEDNLTVRRDELTENNGRSRRSSAGGNKNNSISQAQMKEELEQKQRELEEATQTAEDMEKQLMEVKTIDEKLRTEIVNIKNNFDKLKTQDATYQKELEESHENQEKLLNKV